MLFNEGEMENKRRGVEIVDTCVEEKNKKKEKEKEKEMKLMAESEMKKGGLPPKKKRNEERKNNIKIKNPN